MKKITLEQFTEPYIQETIQLIDSMDWSNPEVYGNWLAQTYYYICHSTRLLAAAASRFQVDRDKLHTQQANHIKEESHHERLAENDLKALGFTLKDFPELTSTKNLYRSTYYMVEREHPISIYGYVYFLECVPVRRGKECLAIVEKAFGAKTSRCLKVHTNDDPAHIATYASFIEELPANERALVEEMLVSTAKNYAHLLQEVKASVGGKRFKLVS